MYMPPIVNNHRWSHIISLLSRSSMIIDDETSGEIHLHQAKILKLHVPMIVAVPSSMIFDVKAMIIDDGCLKAVFQLRKTHHRWSIDDNMISLTYCRWSSTLFIIIDVTSIIIDYNQCFFEVTWNISVSSMDQRWS